MTESEIIAVIATLITVITPLMPAWIRDRFRLKQVKALVISIDAALEDDNIDKREIKAIIRQARELAGTKKV